MQEIPIATPIIGVTICCPTVFKDSRGLNFEGYNMHEDNLKIGTFKVDSFSVSKKGVVRGMHGDSRNWKLVTCLYGKIFLALIDVRVESPTKYATMTLRIDSSFPNFVLIPPGVVNGHQCLSENCVFSYKLSDGYVSPKEQITVKWNDPKYRIPWPMKNKVILSKRDK
jgi:dTDP-4-dehydrorhamnose 3,5-epimerase